MPMDHLFQKVGNTTGSFIVEVDGVPIGSFIEVQGLEVSIEVETYSEGGVNGFQHQLPGRMNWPNLVLKRGVTWNNNLLNWFDLTSGKMFTAEGSAARATAAVTMISTTGRRLRTWILFDALPVRWTGPTLASAEDEVPTEELEVTHHGFESITFPLL